MADCGSFTAAARELHLTQSTLSKHVALLEREFGADLFVRDRSGVSLTEAGGVLYAQARQMEKLLRATELLVRAARDGQGSAGAGVAGATAGAAAGGGAVDGSPAAACDTALRCKCRLAAERCGLDRRELGATRWPTCWAACTASWAWATSRRRSISSIPFRNDGRRARGGWAYCVEVKAL